MLLLDLLPLTSPPVLTPPASVAGVDVVLQRRLLAEQAARAAAARDERRARHTAYLAAHGAL